MSACLQFYGTEAGLYISLGFIQKAYSVDETQIIYYIV